MGSTSGIDGLRAKLFETLDALTDKEKPMDLERAKAVADVAQVIINSAKIEVEYMKVTGGQGSGFIEGKPAALPPGITGSTVHKIKG